MSLSLGNIDVENQEELRSIIHTTVRALDNVIDLNFYPLPYAKLTNQTYWFGYQWLSPYAGKT